MKKINNKGVTLVELIVSFALVSVAIIYFYQTLYTVNKLYNKSRTETNEYVEKTYVSKIISEINKQCLVEIDNKFNSDIYESYLICMQGKMESSIDSKYEAKIYKMAEIISTNDEFKAINNMNLKKSIFQTVDFEVNTNTYTLYFYINGNKKNSINLKKIISANNGSLSETLISTIKSTYPFLQEFNMKGNKVTFYNVTNNDSLMNTCNVVDSNFCPELLYKVKSEVESNKTCYIYKILNEYNHVCY